MYCGAKSPNTWLRYGRHDSGSREQAVPAALPGTTCLQLVGKPAGTSGLLACFKAPGACLQVDGKGLVFDVVGRLKGQPAEVTDIVLEVLQSAVERNIISSRQQEDIVTEVVQGKERGTSGGGN